MELELLDSRPPDPSIPPSVTQVRRMQARGAGEVIIEGSIFYNLVIISPVIFDTSALASQTVLNSYRK